MVLVDTSAWVEFLRDTGSDVCDQVTTLIAGERAMGTTDVVVMELLAGATNRGTREKLWGLLNRCTLLPVRPLFEYEQAAALYVACKAGGFTPANTNDLLIASVAIANEASLLANNASFVRIAGVSSLRLAA